MTGNVISGRGNAKMIGMMNAVNTFGGSPRRFLGIVVVNENYGGLWPNT
jgi:hypothetical protein